jgi:hypothetical protein
MQWWSVVFFSQWDNATHCTSEIMVKQARNDGLGLFVWLVEVGLVFVLVL